MESHAFWQLTSQAYFELVFLFIVRKLLVWLIYAWYH